MPIILMLPNDLDELFTKAKVSEEIAQVITQKIHALHEGAHFKKKFFGSKVVYSINANIDGAHRLLFDLVENALGSVFVLRDIAFHHNYRKALKWRPLGDVSPNELFQLGYAISHHNVAIDVDAIEELPPAILYQDDWLDLTGVQSEVLSQKTFPQLIVGPPGSGKTLVSLAFFQEQALRHQAEGHGLLKLLYITEHPELTLEIESTWRNWAKHELAQDKAHVQAIFLSFSELNKWYAQESHPNATIIDMDSCLNKLKQLSKKRTSIAPSLILDELIHSAHLLNDDIKNNRRYSNSNYCAGGINQTTLSLSDKEIIYDLYHKLRVQLEKENVVFLGFLSIEICPLGFEYDFICVDEAQNSSINHLFNALAMAKANHLIYCGDSYQRSKIKVSSLPLLEPELYKKGISLTKNCLPITHRLQPSVAHLCEHLILLENNLRGGLPDNTAYPSFASALKKEKECSLNFVTTYHEGYKSIGKNAQSAALVINPNDIDEARMLIDGHNVFLSSSAQGLQFDHVFLYLSKETQKKFYELNQKMVEKNISLETPLDEKLNASPTKGKNNLIDLTVLSDLFIALSRSTGNVYLYLDTADNQIKHKLSRFLPWLMNECRGKNDVVSKESSMQEWLTTINLFIGNGHLTQAKDNLTSVFKLSSEQAQGYIDYYKAQRNEDISIEAHMDWLNQSMLPNPKNAISTTSTKASPTAKSAAPQKKKAKESSKTLPAVITEQPLPKKAQASASERTKASSEKAPDNSNPLSEFKPLGPKLAQYVERFFKSIDNQKNIEQFLASRHIESMLFCHKMENGLCLWANIVFNPSVFSIFNVHLQSISKNNPALTHKIEQALLSAYTLAHRHNNTILQLTLGVISTSPNYKMPMNDIPSLEKIIKQIRGTSKLSGFTSLFNLLEDHGRFSLTQFIIKEWAVLTPHLIWQDLVRHQTPGLSLNENGFILSVIHLKKGTFLEKNIEDDSIKKSLAQDLLSSRNPLLIRFACLLSQLYQTEEGANFLAAHWTTLAPHINMTELFKLNLDKNKNKSNSLILRAQEKLEKQIITSHIRGEITKLHSAQGEQMEQLLVSLYQISTDIKTHEVMNECLGLHQISDLVNSPNHTIKETSLYLFVNLVKTHARKNEIMSVIMTPIHEMLKSENIKDKISAVNLLVKLLQINKNAPSFKESVQLQAVIVLLDTTNPFLLKRVLFLLPLLLDNKENARLFIKHQGMDLIIQTIKDEDSENRKNSIDTILMLLDKYYLECVEVGIALIIKLFELNNEKIQNHTALALSKMIDKSSDEMENRKAMTLFINGLSSSNMIMQICSANILSQLCVKYSKEIVAEKGIELCEALLTSEHLSVQRAAAYFIANLSNAKDNIPLIRCIDFLISLLKESEDKEMVYYACHALANLTLDRKNQMMVREGNAIGPLITLLQSPDLKTRKMSGKAMYYLSTDYECKHVITELSGIEALIKLLVDENIDNRAYACSALASISELRSSHETFHKVNGMRYLFDLLNKEETKLMTMLMTKSKALKVLSILVKTQTEPFHLRRKNELIELIKFLSSTDGQDKNNASQLLCSLAVNEQNRKIIFENKSDIVINTLLTSSKLVIQQHALLSLVSHTAENDFSDDAMGHEVLQKTINRLNTTAFLPSQDSTLIRRLCLQSMINIIKQPAQRAMIKSLKNLSNFLGLLTNRDHLIKLCTLELWALVSKNRYDTLYRSEKDIEALINILNASNEEEQVTLHAVTILSNLSCRPKVKDIMHKKEGMKTLVPLLTSQSLLIQHDAMQAIKNLITFHTNNLDTFKALDGINIISTLSTSSNSDIKTLADEIRPYLAIFNVPQATKMPKAFFFGSPTNKKDDKSTGPKESTKKNVVFNFKF